MISTLNKAIIIDDDADAIENLKKLLIEHPTLQIVETISDPLLAVDAIKKHMPDLIFLDIQMPGKNGFEVLHELISENLQPEVIFVTAFDRFAIDAIRFSALDYLLKPVSPFDLNNAMLHFHGRVKNAEKNYALQVLLEKTLGQTNKLKFNTHSGFFMISPEEIIYIQADWNYSEIFINTKKSELVTINIGKLEEMLPKHGFYRISRSFIINLLYLVRVNRRKRMAILVKDGEEYSFKIPLLNIRKIERFIDNAQ